MMRLVDSPHHQLLSFRFALSHEPSAVMGVKYVILPKKTTHFCPSVVVRALKAIENASTSFQKYLRAISGRLPIYDRRQYGRCAFAEARKRGCHRPSSTRGASVVSQLGCVEMTLCINEKRWSGSFWGLTSTLNLT